MAAEEGDGREETYSIGSVAPCGLKCKKRRLNSLDLKTKVIRLGDGWQENGSSTDSLIGLFALKMF